MTNSISKGFGMRVRKEVKFQVSLDGSEVISTRRLLRIETQPPEIWFSGQI